MIDNNLSLKSHISTKINEPNSTVGVIRRTYTYLKEERFPLIYMVLARPHLEYAHEVCSPHLYGVPLALKRQRSFWGHLVHLRFFSKNTRTLIHISKQWFFYTGDSLFLYFLNFDSPHKSCFLKFKLKKNKTQRYDQWEKGPKNANTVYVLNS